ncbi:MAG: hypothetical protein HYY05_06355 [Chloroflexi bacterium]|nr:hypothetical protein [Chloroflexota bacterium]
MAGEVDVFAVQEKVIEDILGSVREQQAVEAAPKVLDPLQQTVITLLRGYLNSPAVKRSDLREVMQRLHQPMTHTALRELRGAYERFERDQDIHELVGFAGTLSPPGNDGNKNCGERPASLAREDLHLVCFDLVWS